MVRWAKQWRPSMICTTPRLTRSAARGFEFLAFQHDAALVTSPRSPFEQVGDGPQSGGLARAIAAEQATMPCSGTFSETP